MMFLFLFLDGVGLGSNNQSVNPFARAAMPNLNHLLGGGRLVAEWAGHEDENSTLLALDACLGVEGLPQSATGQATLLTGINIPGVLGYHYGPKPNSEVANMITRGNVFIRLEESGYRTALLNAYPPRYFAAIESGRGMYYSVPLAVTSAGIPLMTIEDLYAGRAFSADFTARAWREHLGYPDAPIFQPLQAGQRLAEAARNYDFAFFEFWVTDFIGHRQDMEAAVKALEEFDSVLGGLVDGWDLAQGLILVTSDHGNLEDLSTRRHTLNPVPALLIGDPARRKEFLRGVSDLASIAPAIYELLGVRAP